MKKELITSAIACAALIASVTALVVRADNARPDTFFTTASSQTSSQSSQSASKGNARFISQDDFVRAAEQTVNGVVSVKSFATPQSRRQQQYGGDGMYDDPLFEFFFGPQQRRRQQQQLREEPKQQQTGLGSGVIISPDGYIVTNNHVIADAERLEVTLNDNRNFNATVVGSDPDTDLALIKIDAPDLHVIPMGNSEDLRVGEWVLAVGNPFGFTSTVTSGIVSAKARNISSSVGEPSRGGIESYIQTDAAVNRGNSGGALVNLKGELIGINTAIYSQTGTYAGCSFAIPTSIVQKVVNDIHSFGTVQRAYLGISFRELTPELVSEKAIKGTSSGIYVLEVNDRTAARQAGLQPGDVIVSLGNKPTRSTAEMQEAITSFSPGNEVEIVFYRDGKKHTAKATLRNSKGDVNITRADNESSLGAAFAGIDESMSRSLGISHGVAVTELDDNGRFAKAGMRDGFIILSINGNRVSSSDDIKALYKAITKSANEKVMFISGIYPTGKAAYYAVPLDD